MRQSHSPPRADAEADLEPLLPAGWEGPPPHVPHALHPNAPRGRPRRPRLRMSRRAWAIVAVALVNAAVFAVYASVAVDGVRALERQRRTLGSLDTARLTAVGQLGLLSANEEDHPVIEAGVARLGEEHVVRLRALLDDCHDVFAIDPSVRRLRSAVCGAIARDIEYMSTVGRVPSHPNVDRRLDKTRRQWRLDPGQPVAVAPFNAADEQRARLRTYSDERLGVRLVGIMNDKLVRVDIDDSRITTLSNERVEHAVMTRTWVAVDQRGSVSIHDPDKPLADPVHVPLPTTGDLVPNHDSDTMWVSISDGTYLEIDRAARVVSPAFRPNGRILAASANYLVTGTVPDGDQTPVLTVWDAVARRPVKELGLGYVAEARGPLVIWQREDGRLESFGGPLPDLLRGVGQIALARDGRAATLVATTDGLHVTVADGEKSVSREVQFRRFGLETTLAWSPDGSRLFATIGRNVEVFDRDLNSKHLRFAASTLRLLGAL